MMSKAVEFHDLQSFLGEARLDLFEAGLGEHQLVVLEQVVGDDGLARW
jgi:hypothetical protein